LLGALRGVETLHYTHEAGDRAYFYGRSSISCLPMSHTSGAPVDAVADVAPRARLDAREHLVHAAVATVCRH